MADITDIKSVLYTEKTLQSEDNLVVIKTSTRVTKNRLKVIFSEYFGIKPLKITSLVQRGKAKTFKGIKGKRDDFKKFYVKLPEDAKIESLAV